MGKKSTLKKGMYNEKSGVGLFGLSWDNRCSDEVCHGAGWYNRNGEMIGFGSLNTAALERIKAELPEGELFIVVGQLDAFTHFQANLKYLDPRFQKGVNLQSPGTHYVGKYAMFIIKRGTIYVVLKNHDGPDNVNRHGIQMKALNPHRARDLILATRKTE